MFVVIAGNIGSGKSALTSLLHEKFGWVPHYESVENNPYLQDFYRDMSRWAFHLQVYFLSRRFMLHREMTERVKTGVVQDRSIYEDALIFARNLHDMGCMDDRDYANYQALFASMTPYVRVPDLLIYLRADVPTLQRQIRLRGREFEQRIDPSYLEQLSILYENWISNYKLGPLLVVDTHKMDIVHDPQNQEEVMYQIDHLLRNKR